MIPYALDFEINYIPLEIRQEFLEYLKNKTKLDEITGCLNFIGAVNSNGYAETSKYFAPKFYRERIFHRLVWTFFNYRIPKNLCIMHICDNRKCLNIDHLKLGTWAENNTDRKLKGRNALTKGEHHPNPKLTEKDVLAIRDLQGIVSGVKLAKQYNLHYSTIYYIWKRKLWSHI